jgi:hypothetical protein
LWIKINEFLSGNIVERERRKKMKQYCQRISVKRIMLLPEVRFEAVVEAGLSQPA